MCFRWPQYLDKEEGARPLSSRRSDGTCVVEPTNLISAHGYRTSVFGFLGPVCGFQISGFGIRVSGLGFRFLGLGSEDWGLGIRVSGVHLQL